MMCIDDEFTIREEEIPGCYDMSDFSDLEF